MKTLHSSHFTGDLEMRGCFHLHGPQPVGIKGGAPQWVADAMIINDNIEQIVIITKTGGAIYNRMKSNQSMHPTSG